MTAPDRLADDLRRRILDGELPAGAPLREHTLAERYDVARHTARAALRALAADGIVTIEPNRGARVTELQPGDLEALGELRIALETEGALLALRRHGGRLPPSVHAACDELAAACAAGDGFGRIAAAHEALHHAIVVAADSPRLERAHLALGGELQLFLAHLRPGWDIEGLPDQHTALIAAIEADGPDVLRPHIEHSTTALVILASPPPMGE